MGSFDLNQNVDENDTKVTDVPQKGNKPTWRHWMLGVVGFLAMCGAAFNRTTVNQYLYRRVQGDVFPNITFTKGVSFCSDQSNDDSNSTDGNDLAKAQQITADYQLVFSILSGGPAVISSMLLGSFTDKFGRKFLMIYSISGSMLFGTVFAIGSYVKMDLNLFSIAYVLEGVTGELFAFLLAGFAYVADITSSTNRAIGIILFEVSIGLGATMASLVSGYIIQYFGFVISFLIGPGCLGIALLVVIFILQESYPKHKRKESKTNFAYFRHAFEFFYASWNRGNRWKYIIIMLVLALNIMPFLGQASIETLYQLNKPFCWTPTKIGNFGSIRRVAMQLGGFSVMKVMKKFTDDDTIGIVGSLSFAASFVLEGLATNDVMIYLVALVGSCGMLSVGMMRSITSRMTSPSRQGAAAACISMVETMCHLFSGILANAIYGATVAKVRGATFFVMAAFCGVSIILLMSCKSCPSEYKESIEGPCSRRDVTYQMACLQHHLKILYKDCSNYAPRVNIGPVLEVTRST